MFCKPALSAVCTIREDNNLLCRRERLYNILVAGHYLIFQANYQNSKASDCSPSYSHIESPWIEQSLPECVLQFNLTGRILLFCWIINERDLITFVVSASIEDWQITNEHAYFEVGKVTFQLCVAPDNWIVNLDSLKIESKYSNNVLSHGYHYHSCPLTWHIFRCRCQTSPMGLFHLFLNL